MTGNEYNDIDVILENLPEKDRNKIPVKYREFIKSAMVPGGTSSIRTDVPLEEQQLSDETKDLLAVLYLTYWAEGPKGRREYAELLFDNEQEYQGQEPSPMTEDDYQEFLESFDEWNELFGPIPFWAESRNWVPQAVYEIVPKDEDADIIAGEIGLKEVYISPEQRQMIAEEASGWVLVKESHNEETLYWHNNDTEEWDSRSEIEDYYRNAAVIKDGHFFGAVINTESTASMGMSVHKFEELGILFTDGTAAGKVTEYFSHSSDEVYKRYDTKYSLKKKTEE